MAQNDNENELDAALRAKLAEVKQDGGLHVDQWVNSLRAVLSYVSPEKRVELFQRLLDGYCVHCGAHVGDRICHCTNDE